MTEKNTQNTINTIVCLNTIWESQSVMTLLLSIFLNKKNGKVQSKIVHHVVNGNGSTFFNWSWLFAKKKIKCVALSTPWRAFHSATGLYLPSNSFRNSATSYQDIIARAFFFFFFSGGGVCLCLHFYLTNYFRPHLQHHDNFCRSPPRRSDKPPKDPDHLPLRLVSL